MIAAQNSSATELRPKVDDNSTSGTQHQHPRSSSVPDRMAQKSQTSTAYVGIPYNRLNLQGTYIIQV